MSEDNLDLVRNMYVAFHGGDAEVALSYFDSGVVLDATARIDGAVGHGRGDLGRILGEWLARFDDWHEEIEEMLDLGSQVYVVARQEGRAKHTGAPTQTRYAILYEVSGRAISRMTLYREPTEALAAAAEARRPPDPSA